jgi:hypothetical protein
MNEKTGNFSEVMVTEEKLGLISEFGIKFYKMQLISSWKQDHC